MPHPRGCEVSPTELGTRSGPQSCCASLEAPELLPPHRKSRVGTRLWLGFSWRRPRGSWHLDGDPGGIKSKPTLQCFHCLFSTSTGVSREDITSGWHTGRPFTNLYANAPIHSAPSHTPTVASSLEQCGGQAMVQGSWRLLLHPYPLKAPCKRPSDLSQSCLLAKDTFIEDQNLAS